MISKEVDTKSQQGSLVSVIMPVRNEGPFIERSLSSVISQTYPKELLEVVIADGMSTDSTRATIARIARGTAINIRVVDNPKKIAPTGLNCALEVARGDYIVRIDGHCEIAPDYVENCVSLLSSDRAEGVGGPITTIGNSRRAGAIALAMSTTFGVGNSAFRTIKDSELFTDTVAFPGYTRKMIDKAGPFNEEMVRNQDDEYNFRIRKLGGRILLSPKIRSRYYSRSGFRSLWGQYFQYGYWKVRLMQLHPRQMSVRQFVPLIFVVSLLLLVVSAVFAPAARWILAISAGAYVFANLGASIHAARSEIALIPFLALSYLILHLSYGFGFLFGLVAFRGRWRKNP